jgi:hypothetical protein
MGVVSAGALSQTFLTLSAAQRSAISMASDIVDFP